ncbi:MAG TPA: polyphenol oxidase family protein [bacterium]|nr:polyphenol oxidase family protein [bacterium]
MPGSIIKGAPFFTLPALALPGVAHGFGTRDLGRGHAVAHDRIKASFPQLRHIATVRQVHGLSAVHVRKIRDVAAVRGLHADIIIVSAPGVAAAVRTADCVPVLICDPARRVAAAVHTGWKGTALRAAGEAVSILRREYGSRATDLIAGIGPSILPCHYQVDAPVIQAIGKALAGRAADVLEPDGPGHARLDLSSANRIILEEAGLKPGNIQELRVCTYCHAELFFSYRREGKGVPSLYHFIAIVAEAG